MSETAELAQLIALTPLMCATIFYDLRQLRIPNFLVLATIAAFAVLAVLFLPAEVALWRLAGGGLILALGLAAYATGQVGGGDVKLLAAAALFVPPHDATVVLILLSLFLIGGYALVSLSRRITPEGIGWASLERGARYPLGLSIGLAMISYSLLRVGL